MLASGCWLLNTLEERVHDAIEAQITALAARYGEPVRRTVELEGQPFSPLSESDRIGEVCMVVRRPNGRLLTATKTFYPKGAFRLLTGGIKHGEAIEAALLRETWEETGLEVAVRRFLAVVEYRLPRAPHRTDSHWAFVTFAFLLDELGGALAPQDPDERLGEFREVAAAELVSFAERLVSVTDEYSAEIGGYWRDWGRFRAVAHRVVYDALLDAE